MQRKVEKYWTYMAIMLAVALVMYTGNDAWAQERGIWGGNEGELFKFAKTGVESGFNQTRNVVYGVGGMGAIGLGALAFFGRFQWAWFWALVGGLSLIALVDVGITTLTGQNVVGGAGQP